MLFKSLYQKTKLPHWMLFLIQAMVISLIFSIALGGLLALCLPLVNLVHSGGSHFSIILSQSISLYIRTFHITASGGIAFGLILAGMSHHSILWAISADERAKAYQDKKRNDWGKIRLICENGSQLVHCSLFKGDDIIGSLSPAQKSPQIEMDIEAGKHTLSIGIGDKLLHCSLIKGYSNPIEVEVKPDETVTLIARYGLKRLMGMMMLFCSGFLLIGTIGGTLSLWYPWVVQATHTVPFAKFLASTLLWSPLVLLFLWPIGFISYFVKDKTPLLTLAKADKEITS